MRIEASRVGGCALAAALTVAWPSRTEAQAYFEPFVGGMLIDGSLMLYAEPVPGVTGPSQLGSGISDDPPVGVFGVRLGVALGPRWELEAGYSYSPLHNELSDVGGHFYTVVAGYTVRAWNAVWLRLSAGTGGVTFAPESRALNSISDIVVLGGGGLAYRVRPGIELTTDLRFYGQYCDHDDDRRGLACNNGSWLGYSQLTAGFRFRQ